MLQEGEIRVIKTRKLILTPEESEIFSESQKISIEAEASIAEARKIIFKAEQSNCKELKPFKNVDELLYQFYINLDNDCLFTMPVADLETIWDIKYYLKSE